MPRRSGVNRQSSVDSALSPQPLLGQESPSHPSEFDSCANRAELDLFIIDNYLVENILQLDHSGPDLGRRIKTNISRFQAENMATLNTCANQVRAFDNRGISDGRSARRLSCVI